MRSIRYQTQQKMEIDQLIEEKIKTVSMPENIKKGLMISEHRKKTKDKINSFNFFNFAFGQSPFPIPKALGTALQENVDKSQYSNAQGIPELRQEIVKFNKRHFNLDIDPSKVIVGLGTKILFYMIFSMFKGDIIIPSPSWVGYYPQAKILGKKYHVYDLKEESNYKINPEELDIFLSKLENKHNMLIINNPHNPTGMVYKKEELKEIVEVCKKYNTSIISDEIYALITYEQEEFVSMAEVYPEGAFVTNGLSKDRSAGGYRLGYCILPKSCTQETMDHFKKIAAIIYTNIPTPIQYAAIKVFQQNEEVEYYFDTIKEIHKIMGQYISKEFNKIDGIKATAPEGGFYFFADFNELKEQLLKKGIKTSNQLGEELMNPPYRIAVITGDTCMISPENFGARIAFIDYDGKQVFERFKEKPPKTKDEREEFVRQNAPLMIEGVKSLKKFVESLF